MALNLITVAEQKGDTRMLDGYWNTFYCHERVQTSNRRVYGNYCKNGFCPLCSTNRKAEIVNKYYPVLSTWESPHLLTLTVKTMKADELKRWMKGVPKSGLS
jgi:hypothetical protein